MRRFVRLLSLACLALVLAAPAFAAPQPAAQSERRVALVIGNGAYTVGPLKNPANDARDMAAALKTLGFEVILRENASLRQMNEAIDQFWGSLKKGGVGLFFFAGHGLQVAGENFLVPVDARVALEKDVQYECVNAGRVLGRMEDAGNGLNVVILDACRNNPFARSFRSDARGLAKMDAPTGSLVAFATAPGDVAADGEGKNGLYTSHLLRHLRTPGLKIEDVLKQVRIGVAADSARMGKRQTPWESSSLMGDFYFAGGQQSASLGPMAPSAPLSPPRPTVSAAVPVAKPLDLASSLVGEYRLAGHSSTVTLVVSLAYAGTALTGTVQGNNGPFSFDTAVRDVRLKDGQLQFVVVQKGGLFPDIWYRFTCATASGLEDLPIVKTEKRFSATGTYAVSQEFPNAHLVREDAPKEAPKQPPPAFTAEPKVGDTWTEPVTGMVFMWVPGGSYEMGCGQWAGECRKHELPEHTVRVNGFWMGKFEVTQGQWERVLGENHSVVQLGDDYPVETVSWDEAKAFIAKLKAMSPWKFRLPTEAEWEYAARSGGKQEKYAGGADKDSVAWHSDNTGKASHPVGTKAPNGLGLHDMSGNVAEWCLDAFDLNAYAAHARDNPVIAVGGPDRVLRGGSWWGPNCTTTGRAEALARTRVYAISGFRLVRIP